MPSLMLERHRQHPGNVPREGPSPRCDVVVQPHDTCTYTVAEGEDAPERWPVFVLFWDL